MGVVVNGGFVSINAVDYSAFAESWDPSWDLEIRESRPFDSNFVRKDPGMGNDSFTVTVVDDASYTFTKAMQAIKGTKVAFVLRQVTGTGELEWTGTCIVPRQVGAVTQGDSYRYQLTFEVDGEAADALQP